HLGDTRMGQARGIACLGTEPGASFWVTSGIGAQQLHRNLAPQHKVHGPPHLARAARGDRLIQTVPARERNALHRDAPIIRGIYLTHVSSGDLVQGRGALYWRSALENAAVWFGDTR